MYKKIDHLVLAFLSSCIKLKSGIPNLDEPIWKPVILGICYRLCTFETSATFRSSYNPSKRIGSEETKLIDILSISNLRTLTITYHVCSIRFPFCTRKTRQVGPKYMNKTKCEKVTQKLLHYNNTREYQDIKLIPVT